MATMLMTKLLITLLAVVGIAGFFYVALFSRWTALYRGAFIHDIGKIAIPDRILLKKGKLTRAEYDLMKQHPATGDELCRTVRSL